MSEFLESEYEIIDEVRARPRKWVAGEPLTSVYEVMQASTSKVMLWVSGRPYHASFVVNRGLAMLMRQLQGRKIRYAVVNPMYVNWLREELAAAEALCV